MFCEDVDLINNFHLNAGHSKNSIKAYACAFNCYRRFHNMSLTQLLDEAVFEQENFVPLNQLSLFNRIMDFRNYLINNYKANSVKSNITKIKTFYYYNRIELPYFPPLHYKFLKKNECIAYDDLLSKDEIRRAFSVADDDLRMWILVMISSGSSRSESKSMTNEMLFRGTYGYHKKDNFRDALKYLSCHDDVICTCKLIRAKTDKPYYTFLNPETVQFISKIKLERKDYDLSKPVLKYNVDYIGRKFALVNDSLNLGSIGGYRRFRTHMLRKFHASMLNQGSLEMDVIDNLQGRGKGSTREAYFKDNPDVLKLDYIKCMSNVSLYHKYAWEIVDGEVIVYSQKL